MLLLLETQRMGTFNAPLLKAALLGGRVPCLLSWLLALLLALLLANLVPLLAQALGSS